MFAYPTKQLVHQPTFTCTYNQINMSRTRNQSDGDGTSTAELMRPLISRDTETAHYWQTVALVERNTAAGPSCLKTRPDCLSTNHLSCDVIRVSLLPGLLGPVRNSARHGGSMRANESGCTVRAYKSGCSRVMRSCWVLNFWSICYAPHLGLQQSVYGLSQKKRASMVFVEVYNISIVSSWPESTMHPTELHQIYQRTLLV